MARKVVNRKELREEVEAAERAGIETVAPKKKTAARAPVKRTKGAPCIMFSSLRKWVSSGTTAFCLPSAISVFAIGFPFSTLFLKPFTGQAHGWPFCRTMRTR